MNLTDEEILERYMTLATIMPQLYPADIAITITDKFRHLSMQQAKTFHMNVKINDPIRENGGVQKAIASKNNVIARIPSEMYGFPVVTHTVPIINPTSSQVVGAISVAVSLERETVVIDMANALLDLAKSMENSSSHLAIGSETLSGQSQSMNQSISSVTAEIKKMDDIIGYIKSVSETSNLLGLNASIEAARAGEAGRGFAVVAEEIRKLAISSQASSVEILKTLNSLKADVNHLIEGVQTMASISRDQEVASSGIAEESVHLSELSKKLKDMADELV